MSTQTLAAQLASRHQPVKPIPFGRICLEWASVTAISFAALVFYYGGFRADLSARLLEPLFTAEIALNFLLVVVAGLSATACAYPDRARTRMHQILLWIVFTGYSAIFLMAAFHRPDLAGPPSGHEPHGLECLQCLLAFAIIPACWMSWRLRQLACVKPMQMGFTAILMAMATGGLGVRLLESGHLQDGLMLTHYLPILLLSGAGLLLGGKFFRW